MRIRWTGGFGFDTRIITKRDFSSVDPSLGGPIDHDDVVWNLANGFVADVDGPAAEFLLQSDPDMQAVLGVVLDETTEEPKKKKA